VVLQYTFEEMTSEHIVFREWDFFATAYGLEKSVFFTEWTFLFQNMGMRAVILS